MSRTLRFGYYLCIVVLILLVALAWTSIPDCGDHPWVCQ